MWSRLSAGLGGREQPRPCQLRRTGGVSVSAVLALKSPFCLLLARLPLLGDAGDGVGPDLRRPDQRLVQRRPGVGGGERPSPDGEDGLDRTAGEAALQERVDAGGSPLAEVSGG